MQSVNVSPKKLSLVAAAGAVAVMGVMTFAAGSSHGAGSFSSIMADTPTASGPTSTPPSTPSAVPQVKATKFAGGDWTGM